MPSFVLDACLGLPIDQRAPRLIGMVEDQWFDRKSARAAGKDLAAHLVAFANAEGGTILVGLNSGRVERMDSVPARENELRQAAMDFTSPPVRMRVEQVEVLDERGAHCTLLALLVEPGEQVHETNRGDCYLRVGDESRRLTFAQRQELVYDRGAAKYDGEPAPDGDPDILDASQVQAYASAMGSAEPERLLVARGLLTRDRRPTIAGCLVLGDHPQRVMPQAYVRVLRYLDVEPGSGRRQNLAADGDARVEGSIPQMIHKAADIIDDWVPRRRSLGPSGTFESRTTIPRDAWLEGLVNAVVHRSYSLAGDHIRVSIFPDRIEIESPGRFPGLADPTRPLDIARYARNPRIARVCSDLSITQEIGEGIRRMFDEMRSLGLADPVYRQTSGSVRLTLTSTPRLDPAVAARLPMGSADVLLALRRAGRPLGTGEIMELVDRSRPWVKNALDALRAEGEVEWHGKSAKDPRATWSLPSGAL